MFTVAIIIVIAVVGYHWVDKSNFYGALIETKRTGVLTAIAAKEAGRTAKKGWNTTKAVYVAEEKSHTMEYAKAGRDYENEKFANNRKSVIAIKKVFADVNTTLDGIKDEADLTSKACDDFMATLNK